MPGIDGVFTIRYHAPVEQATGDGHARQQVAIIPHTGTTNGRQAG